MNSIVCTHYFASAQGAPVLDLALHRLGEWIDAELGRLEELLDLMGHKDSAAELDVLRGLHLEATPDEGDVARLLKNAATSLERLLERLQEFPIGGTPVRPAPSDFDASVCWSGARLEDMLATLRRALAE